MSVTRKGYAPDLGPLEFICVCATWTVIKGVAANEGEVSGLQSKTRRVLPIFDSPMTTEIGHLQPALPALTVVARGLLAKLLGGTAPRSPSKGTGNEPSPMDTGQKCKYPVVGLGMSD